MSNKTGTRKLNKSEKTRLKIVDTYIDLMTTKKWDKITVKELCDSCSITRSTFYQYYSDIFTLISDLETSLLEDLIQRYNKVIHISFSRIPESVFIEKFDYSPPPVFTTWFDFISNNKKAILALLDRDKGDAYFTKSLKQAMEACIGRSMDSDGFKNDEMRSHFLKIMVEMHIIAAQNWIIDDEDNSLTISDIVTLLNSMRVGACFLNYKYRTDPDYNKKMNKE